MAEVRDEDWDGRDLSGLEHVDSAFVDVDMTQARSANSTDASSEHEHERVLRGLRLVCAAPCTPV